MLKFSNFSLRRGHHLLFEAVDIIIHKQQRVGLVGANGCGKSSLFEVIRDLLHADEGEFIVSSKLLISHVKQETPSLDESALEYVKQGDTVWYQLDQAINSAQSSNKHDELAHLYADLESIGGYQMNAKACKLLSGLGFSETDFDLPVKSFSGGWRMRLNLAQALICRSDILLLDEPTNHLDIETVVWLENWLMNYQGTLSLISHDRDFLDNICTHVLHVNNKTIKAYTGNYSDFERIRFEQQQLQQGQHEKQQREVKHLEQFINRFRAQATKAKQVQSRIKSLEKMQKIAQVQTQSHFSFEFYPVDKLPNPLISMQSVCLGYDQDIILDNINFRLLPGDRIGLLGKNGAGKTTFLKSLSAQIMPKAGEVFVSEKLSIAYFAQHQLEQLDLNDTPYEFIHRFNPRASEQHIRNFLGGFGFHSSNLDNKANSAIAPFSGGEKARLVLASLVYQKPNLLLLDEPTNHLDLDMRNALALALQSYQGCLIVIAHDRYLLNSITNTFYLLEDKQFKHFKGDLDEYWQYLNNKEPRVLNQTKSGNDKKLNRQIEAEKRKKRQPLKKQLREIENKIEQTQDKLSLIDQNLLDNNLYQTEQKEQLKKILLAQGDLKTHLETMEEKWLDLSEELDSVQ